MTLKARIRRELDKVHGATTTARLVLETTRACLRYRVTGLASEAAFFMLLTVKLNVIAAICGVVALAALFRWAWDLDPAPLAAPVPVGDGIAVPAYASGALSTSWWAMIVLMLVASSLFACALFSYLYLWVVAPGGWPGRDALPPLRMALIGALLAVASSAAFGVAHRRLARGRGPVVAMAGAIVLVAVAFAVQAAAFHTAPPTESGYGAIVWSVLSVQGFEIVAAIVLTCFAIVRRVAKRVDAKRRNVFDNARIFWHYIVAQHVVGIVVLYGFPAAVAS
jgi:heme/copper-type cytochrome/quinol oxidase subunit 3